MAAKRKTNTKKDDNSKKDLEAKIAQLEEKLTKLSQQLDSPSTSKSDEAPKPAETAKPKPTLPKGTASKPAETKPAETAKPKPTLPKGFGETKDAPKPAETKPAKPKGTLPKGFEVKEAPKPAETKPAEIKTAPATLQDALENAYMNAPMTDLHHYRAKTTGYIPAPNRYFVRKTAPVGTVPTKNWNDQKATVTGYAQPSNQYFATRARMAYHPADKTFGTFSGVNMTVEGVALKATTTEDSKPAKPKGTLPKGFEDAPKIDAPQNDTSDGKSKQDQLSEYEDDYLKRLEQQKIDDAKAAADAAKAEAAAKASANKKGGALPKGFEAKATPEPAKKSRGTLPKGF